VLNLRHSGAVAKAVGSTNVGKGFHRNTQDRDALMGKLRAYGLSDAAIADITGVTKQRVHQLLGPRPGSGTAPEADKGPAFFVPDMLGMDRAALHDWVRHEFGNYLRQYRQRFGLNQQDLADVLDTSQSSIGHWETRNSCALPIPVLYMLEDLRKRNSLTPTLK
jgi:hypothetical protein